VTTGSSGEGEGLDPNPLKKGEEAPAYFRGGREGKERRL